MEAYSFDVVKDIEKMSLDSVGVRGLAQNLQQGRVRDEEKTRKKQSLLLQITVTAMQFIKPPPLFNHSLAPLDVLKHLPPKPVSIVVE